MRDRVLSTGEQVDWVITDVRFQNEAGLVQELGGQIGLVLRPGIEPVANHVSEEFWQTCSPDIVFQNDGTLEDLVATVNAMVVDLPKRNTQIQRWNENDIREIRETADAIFAGFGSTKEKS